jgi:hypothetical protein
MLLYRYLGSHALETLQSGCLKTSRMSEFNDPFECMFRVQGATSIDEIRKFVISRKKSPTFWASIHERFPHIAQSRSSSRAFEKLVPMLTVEIKRRHDQICALLTSNRFEWDKDFRVICFGSPEIHKQDEILLWSHYGLHHKGVRLGFEFPQLKTQSYWVRQVDYEDRRVALNAFSDNTPEKLRKVLEKCICLKSSAWKYESEYRLITAPEACEEQTHGGQKMDMFRFVPDFLRFIDFGAKISADEKEQITEVARIKYPNAMIRQAAFHRSEFALEYVKA